MNAAGRTEEQRAAYKAKRTITAAKKKKYDNAKIKEIRKIEKLKTPKSVEKLTPEERNQLTYIAFQNRKEHEDFLALVYPDGIPQKKKSRKRMSKEQIMREADRRARRKAA